MVEKAAAQSTPASIPALPTPRTAEPATAFGRWMFGGGRLDEDHVHEHTHAWYQVLWLTGVDYFSTLGYQPGLALIAVGALALPATTVLVLVTLFGAVPIYAQVARRSYAGQGSIAMLENLFGGWWSKIFVLALLGFAATDFVITMTLSAADAARHATANPFLHPWLGDAHQAVTIGLLALLAIVFLMGFREAIHLASLVAVPYLLLNAWVLGWGLIAILRHPELLAHWQIGLMSHGDWTAIFVTSALVFPQLALGLSGFETGVSVMPLVSGDKHESDEEASAQRDGAPPAGRIRATRKLLAAAAILMSGLLLSSSFVASVLIPPSAYASGGAADGRAIAYLAHQLLGGAFGTVYDFSTILILWFAGASAMTGLLSLIPRYLPRFGMAPRWVAYRRPLVLALLGVDLLITWLFHANVEAQGGAYATGVLVLMLSAAIAVALALTRETRKEKQGLSGWAQSVYFWIISLVFLYTLIGNIIERPEGIIIGTFFIMALLAISAFSRYHRSTEMRVTEVTFLDHESSELWHEIAAARANLVPYTIRSTEDRRKRKDVIRRFYRIDGSLAFLHVTLRDNRSEFLSPLRVRVRREDDNYVIEAWGAVATANSIAYLSELLNPGSIFLGLTRRNLMRQAFNYLLWGEGEVGLMVYSILVRYWEWSHRDDDLPRVFLVSS